MFPSDLASSFPPTHWSGIVSARNQGTPEGRAALAKLCNAYWYPVYVLIRRRGFTLTDAADLTQEYFSRLIQGGLLRSANRDKGRFRAFLQTDCRYFLADERDRQKSQKRGGAVSWVSFDAEEAERRLILDGSEDLNPERLFDRAWAMSLLERSFDRLAGDEIEAGRGNAFEQLKVVLAEGPGTTPYATIAETLGITVAAVQSAVARLRRRYRTVLRAEVAATLATPSESDIEDEVRSLYAALGS